MVGGLIHLGYFGERDRMVQEPTSIEYGSSFKFDQPLVTSVAQPVRQFFTGSTPLHLCGSWLDFLMHLHLHSPKFTCLSLNA